MGSIRGLRASIVTFVACLVFAVGLSVPAYAAPKWCEDDPIIAIDSAWAQIATKFDASYLGTITGPIAYEIYVPDFAFAKTHVYLPPSLVAKTRAGAQWDARVIDGFIAMVERERTVDRIALRPAQVDVGMVGG